MTEKSEFFNIEMETMDREQIEKLQLERLKKTVELCILQAEIQRGRNRAGRHKDARRHKKNTFYN